MCLQGIETTRDPRTLLEFEQKQGSLPGLHLSFSNRGPFPSTQASVSRKRASRKRASRKRASPLLPVGVWEHSEENPFADVCMLVLRGEFTGI